MPRIPLPQVDPEAIQPRSPENFTGGGVIPQPGVQSAQMQQLGTAAMSAGQGLESIATSLQDRYNDARTKEAYAAFAEGSMRTLHNPTNGYLNTVGKAATGPSRTAAQDAIQSQAENISKGLDNAVQREMFREVAARHMLGLTQSMDVHESQQVHHYEQGANESMRLQTVDDASKAKLLSFQQGAMQAPSELGPQGQGEAQGPPVPQGPPIPTSPEAQFNRQRNTAVALANKSADLAGFPADSPQRAMLIKQTLTDIHAGVVRGLIARDNAGEGLAYLHSVPQAEMDLATQDTLLEQLKRTGERVDGKRVAFEVMNGVDEQTAQHLAIEQKRRVYIGELNPNVQLGTYVSTLDKMVQSGQITSETHDAARAFVEHQVNVRTVTQTAQINQYRQLAEEWLNNHPDDPAQMLPAPIYQGFAHTGMLGLLSDMQMKNNKQRAAALTADINMATSALRNSDDELMKLQFAVRVGNPGTPQEPNPSHLPGTDFAANYESNRGALEDMLRMRRQMQQNIKSWTEAKYRMEGAINTMPAPEDAVQKWMRKYLATPAATPGAPADQPDMAGKK